ncbi:hypothetical protein AB0F91_38240 [Amycolatopsis sp. NPDC023774]|uniref:hypothetical protein n=1 Tax=Amycolatopsis sp. NPDC023774 TaxID=3155015 RepID=UPI0033CBE5D0
MPRNNDFGSNEMRTQEAVTGGWYDGQDGREGLLRGMLLSAYDPNTGDLVYIGDVGTGFNHQALLHAWVKLGPPAVDEPARERVATRARRGAHRVEQGRAWPGPGRPSTVQRQRPPDRPGVRLCPRADVWFRDTPIRLTT